MNMGKKFMEASQVWNCVVGRRTFLTVQEFGGHTCSAFCGSSAPWFYGGANSDFLQEGLWHMLYYAKSSLDNHLAFLHFLPWDGFVRCLLYTVSDLCPWFFRHSVY